MVKHTKRPTMADIAEHAGVGLATVDRVLTGRRKVREENVRRVLEAATVLGYHATPVIRYRLDRDAPRATFGFVLPKKNQRFYRDLTEALRSECDAFRDLRLSVSLRHTETQDPAEYAACLRDLAGVANVIAASAVKHPQVDRAVEDLGEIPLFTLLNDFATERRRKFIGLDNYRAGRQAGWMLANVIRDPGTIAVLVGGNLWQAHQQRESGLRAYFREYAPEFRLRDAVLNLEPDGLLMRSFRTCSPVRLIFAASMSPVAASKALSMPYATVARPGASVWSCIPSRSRLGRRLKMGS